MKIIIDRIEGDYVVAELPDGSFVNISALIFPDVLEGDVFIIEKDDKAKNCKMSEINKLANKIFE